MITGKGIKMRGGRAAQGSLEYLLILAAVLAIGVVAVLIANQMMGPAKTSTSVKEDKYQASLANVEIKGYGKSFDMSSEETAFETRPEKLIYSPDSGKIVFEPYDKWENCRFSRFYYEDDRENFTNRSTTEDFFDNYEGIKDWEYLFTTNNGCDVFFVEWVESYSASKELFIFAYGFKRPEGSAYVSDFYSAYAYYKSEDCP